MLSDRSANQNTVEGLLLRWVGNDFVDIFKHKQCDIIIDTYKWYMTTCYTWNITKKLKIDRRFAIFEFLQIRMHN